MISPILTITAFVLLLLSAFGVGHPRVHLGWLGLALVVLSGMMQ